MYLHLENMVIYCHWTCQRVKSQQTRTFSNVYHEPDMIYLDLKKAVK